MRTFPESRRKRREIAPSDELVPFRTPDVTVAVFVFPRRRRCQGQQREFTVLSLATTASWKDKNGDGYIRRTEWHKLIAWGNLSTFAATLRKGAHLAVEGELRYREFVPKKQKKHKNGDQKIRVAEIHLWRIAKLDRAEKRDADTPAPELGPETQDTPF